MWATHVHMYTKYEVSTSNAVPGGGVDRRRRTKHDCMRPFG